jgi:hypothetical protein
VGPVRRVEASLCSPLPWFRDIRYRYDLAGGSLMDAGCYALHSYAMMLIDAAYAAAGLPRRPSGLVG